MEINTFCCYRHVHRTFPPLSNNVDKTKQLPHLAKGYEAHKFKTVWGRRGITRF